MKNTGETKKRSQRMEECLAEFVKDEHALNYINHGFEAAQLFDDIVDGDTSSKIEHIYRLMNLVFVLIPSNPFYLHFNQQLTPLVQHAMMDWRQANAIEIVAGKNPNEQQWMHAYAMRLTFYDIAVDVVRLLYGQKRAEEFADKWFVETRSGETFEHYKEKTASIFRDIKRDE